jgi:hypothetical protein
MIHLLNDEMAEIGQFDKISNLWPTSPSRVIEKSGQRKQSSKKEQRGNPRQQNGTKDDDEPGKNIDEYA